MNLGKFHKYLYIFIKICGILSIISIFLPIYSNFIPNHTTHIWVFGLFLDVSSSEPIISWIISPEFYIAAIPTLIIILFGSLILVFFSIKTKIRNQSNYLIFWILGGLCLISGISYFYFAQLNSIMYDTMHQPIGYIWQIFDLTGGLIPLITGCLTFLIGVINYIIELSYRKDKIN